LEDLGYYSALAGIALPNPASVGLHEALGFRPIGVYHNIGYKMGAWRDVGWWQRPLRELRDNPAAPLDFPSYTASGGLSRWLTASSTP
jgi:phosphinothricin acetyltransferase